VTRIRLLLLASSAVAALVVAAPFTPCSARAPSDQNVPDQQTAADQQQIADLVRHLGDRSYRVRESATRALTKVGVPAKAELLKALADRDAEIRYRARLVLADVLELDFKQRLDAFIEDARGTHDHDLPGWQRFRDLVGDGPAARLLFAEIERHESALMEAAELGPEQSSAAFEARCQQIQESLRVPGRQAERQVPLGTVAALLFVGADNNVPLSVQSAMCVTNFCYQQPFRQAIVGGDNSPGLKKLVGRWVQRDFANDSTAAYQTMMLALQFNVREGVNPALAMLKDTSGNPHMRQYALLVVGKFGGPAEIDRLESLLIDSAVCAQQQLPAPAADVAKNDPTKIQPGKGEIVETQIRDVALAVMIHIAGQKLADFGFTRAQPNPTILFNTASLGFANADEREAAQAKWHAWRGGQAPQK
jgi:hypothetical protein